MSTTVIVAIKIWTCALGDLITEILPISINPRIVEGRKVM